jgi:hypothetical protein
MVADYSFGMKNIEIWVPAFLKHNNSFVPTVTRNSPWRVSGKITDTFSLVQSYLIPEGFHCSIIDRQYCKMQNAKNQKHATQLCRTLIQKKNS